MFKINDEEWSVEAVAANNDFLKRSDGSYSIGACDATLRTIFVSSGLPMLLLKKVLCHEITHAAMFSYNVELTLEQEELVADLIATYGSEIVRITN